MINTRKKEIGRRHVPVFISNKKLFTSRAPSHHQAVEYMVYVRERFNSIEKIKQNIAVLDKLISLVHSEPSKEEIFLSGLLIEEIKAWKEAEVRQK